jgi:arylsulfatase A-like enzyme
MPKRPHILIFNPDQWRGDVLGHLGNPAALTPCLDALAEEGVSFRNAFCQNPVCTPSRCSFMTGWYPHTRGHRSMNHMLRRDEPVLLKTLKDNGYTVYWGGKNDLTPAQYGYADYCHIKREFRDEDFRRWGHPWQPGLHSWTDWRGEPGSDTYYSFYAGKLPTGDDDRFFDGDWAHAFAAIDFLREAPADEPLCLYLPMQYPHPPYGVEDPWFSAIDHAALPAQTVLSDEQWAKKPCLLRGLRDAQGMQGWSEARWRELRATYYGMCARTDHLFGLLVAALKETGRYDDTAIFVFSDHGDFAGDYTLVEKTQNTFEDCLSNVPFLIKPPADVPVQPRVSDALVELIDFPATVEALTGIVPAHDHFGRSLLPLLAGETETHRDAVFCEGGRLEHETQTSELGSDVPVQPGGLYYCRQNLQVNGWPAHNRAAMCRTQEFKYVRRHAESDELYDLRVDPGEANNVIADPAYAAPLAMLKERMLDWYLETSDVVPRDMDRRW